MCLNWKLVREREWNHEGSLDWALLDSPEHAGISRFVADLNRVYRAEPALAVLDYSPTGFRWLNADDSEHSVLAVSALWIAIRPSILQKGERHAAAAAAAMRG